MFRLAIVAIVCVLVSQETFAAESWKKTDLARYLRQKRDWQWGTNNGVGIGENRLGANSHIGNSKQNGFGIGDTFGFPGAFQSSRNLGVQPGGNVNAGSQTCIWKLCGNNGFNFSGKK